MHHDAIKLLSDRYPAPANCTNLQVPKLNSEVYSATANKDAANRDRAMQRTQQLLATTAVPLIEMIESVITSAKGDTKAVLTQAQLLEKATDALKLVSTAFTNITAKRKEMIRPSLHKDYASKLCDKDNPVTDQLLGEDLQAQVKIIQEQQKVSVVAQPQKTFNRQNGGNKPSKKQRWNSNRFQPYNNDYNGGYSSQGYWQSQKDKKGGNGGGNDNSSWKPRGQQGDNRKSFLGQGRGQNHQPNQQKEKKKHYRR